MDKKELKFYEAPAFDVVELKMSGVLCASDFEDAGGGMSGEGGGRDDDE